MPSGHFCKRCHDLDCGLSQDAQIIPIKHTKGAMVMSHVTKSDKITPLVGFNNPIGFEPMASRVGITLLITELRGKAFMVW